MTLKSMLAAYEAVHPPQRRRKKPPPVPIIKREPRKVTQK